MPRVELLDAVRCAYRIDTTNWDLIRRWLDEWVPRLRSPDIALEMTIQPVFVYRSRGPAEPDWPADTRFFGPYVVIGATGEEIVTWMFSQRQFIEQRIGELKEAAARG